MNDRRENGQRSVLERAAPERRLKSVKKDVIARPDLINAVEMIDMRDRRRRADADRRHFDAHRAQPLGMPDHNVALLTRDLDDLTFRSYVVRMPRVREDAGKIQISCVRDLLGDINGLRCVRLNAAAVIADIDLDKYVKPDAGIARRPIERRDRIGVIGQHIELRPAANNVDQIVELSRFDWDCVSDIRKPVLRKRPRLGKRRNRYRPVEPLGLYPRDLDTFVGFYVRTKADVVAFSDMADPFRVSVHSVKVEQQRRRFE